MNLKNAKELVYLGTIMVGLGTFGIISYMLNRQAWHDAMRRFSATDRASEIRTELLKEEGISDEGSSN